jgi:drug/metabolite transporter (DMT)-like permease
MSLTGLVFGLFAGAGWGISLAAARHGADMGMTVSDLAFIRYVTATLALTVFLAIGNRGRRRPRITLMKTLALIAVAGPALTACVLSGARLSPLASGVLVESAALAVGCIVFAALLLKEPLNPVRWTALLLLGGRIVFLIGSDIRIDTLVPLGLTLFCAAGAMSAFFTTLVCRWRIAPTSAMAIVSISSLTTFGPYYLWSGGIRHLLAMPPLLLFEQIICQGLIAGFAAWVSFVYSARLLGLVSATFLPAITPAIAVITGLELTDQMPTGAQWALILLSFGGAMLLVISRGSFRLWSPVQT